MMFAFIFAVSLNLPLYEHKKTSLVLKVIRDTVVKIHSTYRRYGYTYLFEVGVNLGDICPFPFRNKGKIKGTLDT